MNNEEKITQETKKFIQLVINMYLSMGPETKINVELSDERTLSRVGNKEIYVSVLNQVEADKLKEMKEKIDELNGKSKRDPNNEQESAEKEEDFLEVWESIYKEREEKKRNELLDEYANYSENEKQKVTPQKKHKKNLRNTFKKLKNKVYKLSEKTKEKAIKAKKYLEENGKKVGSLIVIATLLAGVATHEIYSDVKGYQTYEEYGSTEKIELSANEIIANEVRKALNNDNLEIKTDDITLEGDLVRTYRITIIDPNNPDFEMSIDVGAFEWNNPSYMTRIVEKYEKIKNINNIKNHNKITDVISAAKAGRALNDVKEYANGNDAIVTVGITGEPNMDRVPERIVKVDTDDMER